MKNWKQSLITFLAMAAAVICILLPDTTAWAVPQDKMFDANGLFFGTSHYSYDKVYVDAAGQLQTEGGHSEYVDKLRLVKDTGSDYYPSAELYLYQNSNVTKDSAQIVAVKSSNKNLKCIISYSESSAQSLTFTDDPSSKPYTSLSCDSKVAVLAKKAGTYTVTVTVKMADGKLVTKKATVKVDKKSPIIVEPDSKKFSGIDNTFDAKSLKVKVNKSKSVKNMSCYYSNSIYASKTLNKTDNTYSYNYYTFKKFKSGKKIKLNTKYSASYTNPQATSTRKYTTNYWYAPTTVLVIYTDSFYGINTYMYETINKYRKIAK